MAHSKESRPTAATPTHNSAAPATTRNSTEPTTTRADLSKAPWLEITRYLLYTLDFIFGILLWGTVADKLNGSCVVFSDNSGTASPVCDVIIAFGVIMLLLLLGAIAWHTLGFFFKPGMPPLFEAILFASMSLLWFILAIIAVATSPAEVRRNSSDLRAALAGGWLAGFTHLGSAVVAFIDWRTAR